MADNMMRVIQVSSWHEASKKAGTRIFDAVSKEEAIALMKRNHPGIVPHTCLWHPQTEHINRYYFLWQREGDR